MIPKNNPTKHSMFTILLATMAALAGLVSAQNGTYSTSGPLTIDPNSVDPNLRRSWCTTQRSNCPKICAGPDADLGDADPNNCDEVSNKELQSADRRSTS